MTETEAQFEAYWARFLRASTDPAVLRAHFAGTSAAIGAAAIGAVLRRWLLLLASPGIAIVPPALVRKIRGALPIPAGPLVFQALALLKLWRLALVGGVEAEMRRMFHAESEEESFDEGVPLRQNMITDHTLH